MTDGRPWPAPAKLNLFLSVTGRLPDGYHSLQTVFQLVDLCDELDYCVTANGRIERGADPAEVAADTDLCVQAARRLREVAARPDLGVRIRLHKRIALGGGLGGGSSDAATTLVALDRLWQLHLGSERLAAIARELGADVPLFVAGHSAWAEGAGERLTAISLPSAWYAIIYPGVGVATRDVFQAPELTRNSPAVTLRDFLAWSSTGTVPRNDLTAVVAARHPGVRRALAWLGERAAARLTGSGACVFAAFDSEAAAAAALADLPAAWQGIVARGLDRSPLLDRRAAEG
jgi:4-diphosphocytidyl-2-C-methyl-D-erythritol kinase